MWTLAETNGLIKLSSLSVTDTFGQGSGFTQPRGSFADWPLCDLALLQPRIRLEVNDKSSTRGEKVALRLTGRK